MQESFEWCIWPICFRQPGSTLNTLRDLAPLERWNLLARLTNKGKAAIYSVLSMAVGAALLIRVLDLSSGLGMWVLWSFTPTVAALVMLLVVSREGYAGEGWRSLGLHRAGLGVWWIAFGGTPLAELVVPGGGIADADQTR